MADKKSFVMYESWGAAISKMSDAQAGALIKAIYEYQRIPNVDTERALSVLFDIIKNFQEKEGL